MEAILMKCGHISNATKNGKSCCVICNCDEVQETKPSLTGRKARCSECGAVVDSDWDLPFFEYKPNNKFDSYYDGCNGWD